MDNQLLINSIYRATEGEGIYVGRPQVFIRFQGCQVGCLNCDSKETWGFDEKFGMEMGGLLDKVDEQAGSTIQWISITGGDPLHPRHRLGLEELIKQLKSKQYLINLEAAGVRMADGVFQQVDFISFDYKPPSTGIRFPLGHLKEMAQNYLGKFQIKAVVEDTRDFKACLGAYQELERTGLAHGFEWCLTPAYSPHETFNPKRFIEIMSLNYEHGCPFRVIGQQHKWVYGPHQRQV